jgi:hypothetical protein
VRLFSVKLLLVWMAVLGSFANAQEEQPDPRELLKSARVAQANMDWKFTGHLREGASSKKIPFVLTISNGLIRYEFQDNKDAITLRIGDRDTRLEETIAGGVQIPLLAQRPGGGIRKDFAQGLLGGRNPSAQPGRQPIRQREGVAGQRG